MTEAGTRIFGVLTNREKDVLRLLCETSYPNRTIGQQIGTTEQVIKNYTRSILDKTGCESRIALVLFAFAHGLVTCPCPKPEPAPAPIATVCCRRCELTQYPGAKCRRCKELLPDASR